MITAKEAREQSIENKKRSIIESEDGYKFENIIEQIEDAVKCGNTSIEIDEDTDTDILDLLKDLGFKSHQEEYSGLITISW